MKSTTQAQLFALSDMVMGNKPMAVYLNENEAITELRRQLACTQDALKTVIAEHNKTISEKNATLVRQENELKDAGSQCHQLRQTVKGLLEDVAFLQKQNREFAKAKKSASSSTSAMPKEVWRRLLQLCHPDKHANADAATAATQWLNANKPA